MCSYFTIDYFKMSESERLFCWQVGCKNISFGRIQTHTKLSGLGVEYFVRSYEDIPG